MDGSSVLEANVWEIGEAGVSINGHWLSQKW